MEAEDIKLRNDGGREREVERLGLEVANHQLFIGWTEPKTYRQSHHLSLPSKAAKPLLLHPPARPTK